MDDEIGEFDYTEAVTPVSATPIPPEAFPDDTDPGIDPCPGCSTRLVRIKSDEPTPANGDEAARRFLVCAAARDDAWSWCVRGSIGEVRLPDGSTELLMLE